MARNQYMWKKDGEDLVKDLSYRVGRTHEHLVNEGSYNAVKNSYNGFYNRYWQENAGVGKAGEQGEFHTISVNHFGSLIQNVMNLITVQRLTFDVQTFKQDYTARETQMLAKSVLEMYFYERNYEEEIRKALSLAYVTGTSYIGVTWEPKSKLYGVDEKGKLAFVGKALIKAHDVFSVTVANPYEDDDSRQPWVVVRERANRYDLVAKYPDKEDEILGLPHAQMWGWFGASSPQINDEGDFVWIYRGYHRECPALPKGRMVEFADSGLFLQDWEENPYVTEDDETLNGGIPLFTLRPKVKHGSAFGYTPAFDMIAVQENLNMLDSTIASNQLAFGVQNIAAPRSAGIKASEIAGGARFLEYDVDENGKGLPEVLDLCRTPTEIFNQRANLVKDLEALSGINATMRGRIETSVPPSGVSAALMTANGQLANSDVEYRYHRVIEKVARFFLYTLSRFQVIEDYVEVGDSARARSLKGFTGDNLSGVANLKISLGNPLVKTTAGRVAFAELAAQQGMIKSPEQLSHIMITGEIENELQNNSSEIALIRYENEQMFQGNPDLVVAATDNHNQHILEHRMVSLDPRARQNAQIMEAYSAHVQKHLDIMDVQMVEYPQLYSLITTGQPIMPQPSPESGVSPEAAVQGLSEQGQATMDQLMGPGAAGEMSEAVAGPAMAGMKAAENKLEQALGSMPS